MTRVQVPLDGDESKSMILTRLLQVTLTKSSYPVDQVRGAPASRAKSLQWKQQYCLDLVHRHSIDALPLQVFKVLKDALDVKPEEETYCQHQQPQSILIKLATTCFTCYEILIIEIRGNIQYISKCFIN